MQTLALYFAPLTLVQPALAAGLVFLLFAATRFLHEHVGRFEVTAVLGIVAGVGVLGWAAPRHSAHHDTGTGLLVTLIILGVAAVGLYGVGRFRRSVGSLIAVAAGLAFSFDALATKFFTDDFAHSAFPGSLLWFLAMIAAAGLGVLSETSAFQARPATQVAPVVFATGTIVPVVIAPFVAGEAWSGGAGIQVARGAAIALTVAGAMALTRSPAVTRLLRAESSSEETVVERSPLDDSAATTRSSSTRDAGEPDGSDRTTIAPARSPSSRNG
jgi:drug/metabolite transporter (DMT)-like permease